MISSCFSATLDGDIKVLLKAYSETGGKPLTPENGNK